MGDITLLLQGARGGDSAARDALFARVYAELHSLARAKLVRESTLTQLDAPSLVNEAYLRLVRQPQLPGPNRRIFFAYAARVMRSVIVDYVRERRAQKRGGGAPELSLTIGEKEAVFDGAQIEAVDSALCALERIDERCHRIVEMRYFAGLSLEEIAESMDLSVKTVKRDWQKARAFLFDALKD